ncbi:MAG: hypothetical protein NVS3B3_21490 [Aquirhabdus sp.]
MLNRFKEASTWAGFGVLFQVAKAFLPQYAIYLDGASAIAGTLAGLVPEKAKAPTVAPVTA